MVTAHGQACSSPYLHPKLSSLSTELNKSPRVNVGCTLVYIPSLVGGAYVWAAVIQKGATEQLHNPVFHNCAIFVVTVKPHIVTSTKLYRQGIAPGSQYSDLALEAATLH